ncbi:hypothetical protein Rhow_000645 [Rhodococcus wratislaviensis]|jgi:hypothetical protein|uniref:Uncharacterized protein n=1 Tax=Rhodococcus wratislaviensis TaxID=44752 RepID=A0A402C2C7_RHOWR|nr:hypothetical protein [Rhodococcus wratislaviensis]GCE37799.1 hypothetical protein Rhow_000645 [Rhodococcus wratislaviensis]
MNTQTTQTTAIHAGVRGTAHGAAISTEEIKARIEAMFADDGPDRHREAR